MKISNLLRKMKVEELEVGKLVPYANNARNNEEAVPGVVASIQRFGFRNPILVDRDNVIVEGHTRRLAAIQLGMAKVPVIRVLDLTKKQVAALRLADNKLSELSSWDFDKLDRELAAIAEMDGDDLDMGEIGFPSLDDDPILPEDAATAEGGESGEAQTGVAVPTDGGARVPGVGGTLPPELAGQKLTPDAQEKIDVEAQTNKERVIIVFDPAQRAELAAILGFVPDKVVYRLEEVIAGGKPLADASGRQPA